MTALATNMITRSSGCETIRNSHAEKKIPPRNTNVRSASSFQVTFR